MEHMHTLRDLMRVRLAKFAAVVLGLTILAAVFAPWLAPYDPVKAKPWDSLHPPSSKYWLGADRLGRDQLSRLIYGARVSLVIGVGGVAFPCSWVFSSASRQAGTVECGMKSACA